MSQPPKPNVILGEIHVAADPAKTSFKPKPGGALVEDTSVVGTTDGKIVPRGPGGLAEAATDPRERKSEKPSGPDGA